MWLGVIGGSGLYKTKILKESDEVSCVTPFGQALVSVGQCGGKKVAFLARHGKDHSLPPHLVNYRANLWALSQMGVGRVLATAAVGSLREDYRPGDFVLLDQFIDFTRSRPYTFFDEGGVRHVDMTEPYCPGLNDLVADAASTLDLTVHREGTYICTEGPRFETPAEIRMFRSWGADLVGMTNVPEVVLAREAGLCYSTVAIVTNMAAGINQDQLSHDEVVQVMAQAQSQLEDLIEQTIARLDRVPPCRCPARPRAVGEES